jgi:hypothetical protein
MAEMLATRTSRPGCGRPGPFEVVRAEALFVSTLQPSGSPSPDQVRRAVTSMLRRLGARGCAAWMAGEFGDHPDAAVTRMSWALATIHAVYPPRPGTEAAARRPLVFAG